MRRAVLVASAGALMAAGFVGLVTVGHDDHPRPAAPTFLAAWRRSLSSTYRITERIERTLVDGRRLVTEVTTIQRPPDRVRVSGDQVDALLGGRAIACVVGSDGRYSCRDTPADRTFAAQVDADVSTLGGLIAGPAAPYSVSNGERGCFVLRLRARILAPPYGEDATFCFDPSTGAPSRSIVHRAEGTDVHTTVSVTTAVNAADVRIPDRPPGG